MLFSWGDLHKPDIRSALTLRTVPANRPHERCHNEATPRCSFLGACVKPWSSGPMQSGLASWLSFSAAVGSSAQFELDGLPVAFRWVTPLG